MSQVRFDFFETFVRCLTAQGSRWGSGVKICGRDTKLVPEVQRRTALNTHNAGLAVDRTVEALDFAVDFGDVGRHPNDGDAVSATPLDKLLGFQLTVVHNVGADLFSGATLRLKLPGA
jgi:hypothetical protein